eukprot:gene31423-37981_t
MDSDYIIDRVGYIQITLYDTVVTSDGKYWRLIDDNGVYKYRTQHSTCFLVEHPSYEENEGKIFVVLPKAALSNALNLVSVRLLFGNLSIQLPKKQLHSIFIHPDRDITIIAISEDSWAVFNKYSYLIPLHPNPNYSASVDYYFAGFPLGHPPARAFVASSRIAGFHEDEIYLTDPSIRSYSGGPCVDLQPYIPPNTKTPAKKTPSKQDPIDNCGVVGIASATRYDKTGIPMASVVPWHYVLATFDYVVFEDESRVTSVVGEGEGQGEGEGEEGRLENQATAIDDGQI